MKQYLFIFLCLLFFVPAGYSQALSVKVGVYQAEPLVFMDSNGKASGFFIDVLEFIGKQEGWRFSYVSGTFDQCLERLEEGRIDLLADLAYTEGRATVFSFNREVVFSNWAVLYRNRDVEIETITDLHGKIVAVVKKDIYSEGLKALVKSFDLKCRFVEVDNYGQVFQKITNNEVDGGAVSYLYGIRNEDTYEDSDRTPVVFSPVKLFYAAPRDRRPEMLAAIDRHLSAMKSDVNSPYYQFKLKWIDSPRSEWKMPDWMAVLLYTGVLSLVVAVGFIVLLRARVDEKTRDLYEKNEELVEYQSKLENLVDKRTAVLQRTARELKRRGEQLNQIILSMEQGLLVLDEDHRLVIMNPSLEEMLEGVLAKECETLGSMFVDPEITTLFQGGIEKKQTGYSFRLAVPRAQADGTRMIRFAFSVIQTSQNRYLGAVILATDITKEHEIDRMKTEFISTAAHELRTPLTTIQGYSELLLTRDNLPGEKRNRFMQYIHRQAVQLANIINDLLDVSRLESGRSFVIHRTETDLKELVEKVVDLFRSVSERHGFQVHLPATLSPAYLDAEKMEQVMKNLISNAVKYSPRGGTIFIGVTENDRGFEIKVRDEGIGMTADHLNRVFEKFFRADASDTAPEGTGLGLCLVKHIVEGHQGNIKLESVYGAGTTAVVAMPKKESA